MSPARCWTWTAGTAQEQPGPDQETIGTGQPFCFVWSALSNLSEGLVGRSHELELLEALLEGAAADGEALHGLGRGNDTRRLMRVADHADQPSAADPGGAISQVLPCRQPARGDAEASHRPHGRALLSGPDGLTSGEQLLVSGRSGSAVDTAARTTMQVPWMS